MLSTAFRESEPEEKSFDINIMSKRMWVIWICQLNKRKLFGWAKQMRESFVN
jgi:hypothetical protein